MLEGRETGAGAERGLPPRLAGLPRAGWPDSGRRKARRGHRATDEGWRWWTPGAAEVQSDWCREGPGDPDMAGDRPSQGEAGWVRVVVSGEVFGPLAALWPDRLDTVYAAATGPAVLATARDGPQSVSSQQVPVDLPTC